MNELELIKSSFEKWYNAFVSPDESLVINYSDEQTLLVKAYHKATISLMAVGIKDNMSYTKPLFNISENYNHGITSESEAKFNMMQKLLVTIFDYCSDK